ncbi:MAG: hypothetical protein M3Q58_08860, partial [Bacteroidota bacterium]|nr:hypothetical protein [Bacteroidota bacterium]
MERSIFFIVFILFSNFLCAQTLDKEYDYFNQEEAEFLSPVNDPISGSKTNFGLMTGTSVGAFSGRNSFV